MRLLFALAICLAVLGLGSGCDAKMTTEAGNVDIAGTETKANTPTPK